MADQDELGSVPERELARIERRDRRRRVRMVVDNAGLKRVLKALAERRRQKQPGGPPEGPPRP
ncbi:MAG TPA: hypothetical protein VEK76_13305 [Candidatus Binatia bacterium]|nr:hypothetical protein [Candidatus Binatia bacterium]